MELQYERNQQGILSSLSPIYEWWAFGNLYGRTSWGDWSIANANKVQVQYHRGENGAELHIYGNLQDAMPVLKDAAVYFNVEYKGSVSFYDAFTKTEKNGVSYKLSLRS